MKRLTERFSNGQATVYGCGENCKYDFKYCEMYETYEDCPTMVELYEKLAAYEEAEDQGLLIRLPCKVGDTIYEVAGYCWDCSKQTDYCHLDCKEPKYRVRHWKVEAHSVRKGTITIHGHIGQSGILGENVFLTMEEAEAALAEMEGCEWQFG